MDFSVLYTMLLGIGSVSEYLWYMTSASRANGPLTCKDSTFTMQRYEVIDFFLKIYLPVIYIWISFTWRFSFYTSVQVMLTRGRWVWRNINWPPPSAKYLFCNYSFEEKNTSKHYFWKLMIMNSPKLQLQNCTTNNYAIPCSLVHPYFDQ